MPFTLDPGFVATASKIFGNVASPPPAVGDIQTRRKRAKGIFELMQDPSYPYPDVEVKEVHAGASDGNSLLCRFYFKKGADFSFPGPAVLYAHGGGMIALSIDQYAAKLANYVRVSSVPFFAVEYRLAPEVRAPTLVTDTYAALEYLVSHAAEFGVDPNRIAVMGDSAGGGIAAGLTHYIRREKPNGPKLCKQILIYPMLDDRTVDADPETAPFLIWTADDNKTGWGALLGDRMGKPGVSPVDAPARATVEDARGLPPAYIEVGDLDHFRDEDMEYVRTLARAGVHTEFHLVPGMAHGYDGVVPDHPVVKELLAARTRWFQSL